MSGIDARRILTTLAILGWLHEERMDEEAERDRHGNLRWLRADGTRP